MSVIIAGNTNYNRFLQKFYSSNRIAGLAANRINMGNAELLAADSSALKKISENLRDLSYDADNGQEIYQNIKALTDTYNNLVDSSGKIIDSTLERNMKKLKSYIKDNQEAFEEIGLKISSSGKLTLDKDTLLKCTPKKIGRVFSESNTISSTLITYSKKLSRLAKPLTQDESRIRNQKAQEALLDLPVTTSTMNSTKIDYMA